MANKDTRAIGQGMGLTGTLLVIFIVLKVLGLISWSWWWVFSPIWITIGFVLAILLLFGLVIGVVLVCQKLTGK